MRTTVDIDDPILKEVKRLQKTEGKSLGRLISNLLAKALRECKPPAGKRRPSPWISKGMGARVDLEDKEALYAAMERQVASRKKNPAP